MARILSIDYGTVRCGIAVTDILQLIPNALETVGTAELEQFLKDYFSKEDVETIVIGFPKTLQNSPAKLVKHILLLVEKLKVNYPDKKIELIDERYTSKMAFRTMVDSGIGRKALRNKALIDKISATIILQSYLDWRKWQENNIGNL